MLLLYSISTFWEKRQLLPFQVGEADLSNDGSLAWINKGDNSLLFDGHQCDTSEQMEKRGSLHSLSQCSLKWGMCKMIYWGAGKKYENFSSTST